MSLRVPPQVRVPVKELLSLSSAEFSKLVDAVKCYEGQYTRASLSALVDEVLEDTERAEKVVNGLTALVTGSVYNEVELPDFLKDVRNTLFEAEGQEQDETVLELLVELARSKPIFAMSKALLLASCRDNLVVSNRIFTDIRPVFGVEPKEGPLAFSVVHTLELSHTVDGSEKSFSYFAVDMDTLRGLRDAISRAIEKEEILRGIKDVPVFS